MQDYKPCDVYSAGIILFILMSGGNLPFLEKRNPSTQSKELQKLREYLDSGNTKYFWDYHIKLATFGVKYSASFRNLFEDMTSKDPAKRPTLI
mmetsp:Transcript_68205/g.94824  ORF Transcript_68205/g.94824 Transcript_68205/m.94824 type:complete len:93 (+) Transcript_68205:248-526(+)